MLITLLFFSAYVVVAWILLMWAVKKNLAAPVALGIGSRLVLCSAGLIVVLPLGGADAIKFERLAWAWSQGSLSDVLSSFDPSRSYLISSITAVFYHYLDRNLAIPVAINGILGLMIMYYGLRLADKVWPGERRNHVFAFIVALHPLLNLHSAVVLRENYILLFLLIACVHLVGVTQGKSGFRAGLFVVFIVLSSFFHGGMVLFTLGLPFFFVINGRGFGAGARLLLAGVSACAFALLFYHLDLGKVADIQEEGISVAYLADLESARQEANTAYLVGMAPSNIVDVVWQLPLRVLFFLFKPFPWDVSSPGHAVAFLDALLWIGIAQILVKNWAVLRRNPAAMAILVCSLVTIVAFAYGTGNYGTAVRHRTKFIIPMLVVIYPFLPRFRLYSSRRPALH